GSPRARRRVSRRSAVGAKADNHGLLSGVSIVEPRFRRVGVSAHFPEPFPIVREKLDLADPFGALPGVELRRNHPARSAMLARQRGELTPRERERVFDATANLERPAFEWHDRLLAEIEHRPGLHLVLADRQLRHSVAIRRARALGALAVEPNVDGLFVQLELTL